jgi:endonuclease/exonuclease/phosphatase family metal-dependent hydrolase
MALCQAPVDAPAASAPASPALTPIVLDSLFDDWRSLKPVTADPVGDAPTAFVDLGEVRVNVDDNFVHFLVDFGRTVNVQGLDGTAMLVLNADGGDESGVAMHEVLGVDIIIDLSPLSADHPGAPGRGIGLRSTTYTPDSNNPALPPLNPYDIHFAFAPTHAGRRIEFRIGRGVFPKLPPLFLGRGFTGQVIFSDLTGSIQDETEAFTIALPPRPAGASTQPADAGQPTDPLARAPGTQARIMNWNVERSAMIANPDVFVRVFNTLKPDVVLLQELTDKTTLDELRAFASHILPNDPSDGGQWHVMIGQGGGDLRCGIVSRFPLTAVPPLDPMTMISRPDRTVRALGALIDVAGRPLLATSLHLKCCGRLGSSEDQTRLEEVAAVHRALTAACEELKPQALLIAGDFNLVGSRDPLEQLVTALDLDGSPLEIVDAYQIDGRSNATWADRDQPFVPGRLDYALFSDSSLVIRGCFVYDAFDLAPRWCEVHGAQTRDTSSASDHLPVVFDVAWK